MVLQREHAPALLHAQSTTPGAPPPADATFVVPRLHRLITIVGTRDAPATDVTVRGLGLRDSRITFMEPWGVPSGGDWSLHRGAAVFLERTEGVTVAACSFVRLDGNALQLSGYNRRAAIVDNEFRWIGDTAMSAWGYTDEHDGTGGDQPRGTLVARNKCHEVGMFELQSACWFQAKTATTRSRATSSSTGRAPASTVRAAPPTCPPGRPRRATPSTPFARRSQRRSGGGNEVVNNVIFNQCRQSGDHGPINSWDRQLFWTDAHRPSKPGWNPAYTTCTTT